MKTIDLPRGANIIFQVPKEMLLEVVREVIKEEIEALKKEVVDPLEEYPPLLTTNQVANILQVTRSTVASYANDPLVELDRLQMGKNNRYKKDQVIKLFKNPIKGQRLRR